MDKQLNVLLATMQLVIGGAETHVVELAKELKRRGYNVIVASNGGVYEKELEESGIKHYCVPLHNKKPYNMSKAIKLLEQIIINEKIDIVHSHARIPSFILNKLHKKIEFPFVTTAHWVFNTKYGLKYITPWGEKVVAVSEDIKKYLIENYKIPEADIRVTINGIDTDKFSPYIDTTDIKEEFNISKDENVIVYVSRLDESRSLVAKQLIDIVPKLNEKIENLRVVIVGGGDDFENVMERAARVNAKLERETITLAGARTDINKFVAMGKLFIGVSRAALEAMAAARPVIIAGNEGYIGLFDESKLDVGIKTNFCCRGCVESSAKLLLDDIEKFLDMSKEEQDELGFYGRNLIINDYSVSRMADDTTKVYDWALSKKKEILISGYYGFKNNGDDALLHAIIKDLKRHKESPNIVVLSADPKETFERYKVNAINRLNIFKIIKHMKNAELLLSGGGTLMQDKTSSKSLWYYLGIIKTALHYNVKVMLYSNGIGPLNKKKNINAARNTLNNVDLITLRDNKSFEVLRGIGVKEPKIVVSADPAFNLSDADFENGRKILDNAKVPKDQKLLGISVRKLGMTEDSEREIAKAIDKAAEKYGLYPVFIPMQEAKDTSVAKSIMDKMIYKSTLLSNVNEVNSMIDTVSNMHVCVGMRLHLLTYAVITSVPVIGIVCDPKISGFMEAVGQDLCIPVEGISADNLFENISYAVENHKNIKEQLQETSERLKDRADMNGRLAIELYEKERAAK